MNKNIKNASVLLEAAQNNFLNITLDEIEKLAIKYNIDEMFFGYTTEFVRNGKIVKCPAITNLEQFYCSCSPNGFSGHWNKEKGWN